MTKIKFCGLSREEDILTANELRAEYIGFMFYERSKRFITHDTAKHLRGFLWEGGLAVGVFVNEAPTVIAELLQSGVIDIAQLHGAETEEYIRTLRSYSDKPIIKAFSMDKIASCDPVNRCSADLVLLDTGGGGSGEVFDWTRLRDINRPYLLAGGLHPDNVGIAVRRYQPYAVDVSSGIEENGKKSIQKMKAFANAVRGATA